MGFNITNGSTTLGELFSKEVAGQAVNLLEVIAQGNSAVLQKMNMTNRYFQRFIKELPCVPGQRVPVERWNIQFSEGGVTSDAPEFNVNRAHFKLKKQTFKVMAFKHEFDDVMTAKNLNIDLLSSDVERVEKAKNVYVNTYLPTMAIQTLISGDSSSTTLPVSNVGGTYTSQFGVLRGEDCSDILYNHVTVKNVNMLRSKKSTTLTSDDIFETVQKLKDFVTNQGGTVEGIGSPRSIWKLKNVLSYDQNVDKFIVDGVPMDKIAGTNFATIEGLPDGFLFFVCKTAEMPIIKAVEPDMAQRGLIMIETKGISTIKEAEDMNGAYLQISKEGYHWLRRESVAILDIDNAHTSGDMQAAGITALETFLASVRAGLIFKY